MVVKCKHKENHIKHLRKTLERLQKHQLLLNSLKCALRVRAGNFMGFLVHQKGVEVDKNKVKVTTEVQPLRNKKEIQRFLG